MSDAQGAEGAMIPWDELDADGRIARLAFQVQSLRHENDSLRKLVEIALRGVDDIFERLDDIEAHPALSIPAIVGRA